ncbi:hypothetical protein EGY20_15710 [Burkholderia multivorans]|uniref:Sulfotransferase family protein n=2 Tax=Burkholderia multivorans TaxID=87883 RepID=A0AB37AQ54_9BURK|nr:hypothetical protein EGY20_15710 [Burkholderia multivorans]KVQ79054.1 hypothetical protein WK07_14620 [Burkholderia multivorans]MCA8438383.1 sulfotransferase family protein [Burkholderia multivorans]PRE44083.1 hypothetical protein C6P99_22150 [Burkholderia multivorans]PRE53454.1 hypothetical protein C6P97_05180 [Burkholderia multivorans]
MTMHTDPVYFLHIPKTGGSSLISFLEDQFDRDEVCPAQVLDELFALPKEAVDRYNLFRGHHWYGIESFVGRRLTHITMLREPVQRTVSWYLHALRHADTYRHQQMNDEGWSLLDFVRHPETNWDLVNTQTLFLAADFDYEKLMRDPVGYGRAAVREYAARRNDRTLLERAKKRLESFAFFGITERMRDSMNLLAYSMGFSPRFETPRLNTSSEQPVMHELTMTELDAINELTELDQELYAWGCALFEERMADMVRSLLIDRFDRSDTLIKRSWHARITEHACARININVVDAPTLVGANTSFDVRVDVSNQSNFQLSSRAPNPVHLSYHWLDGTGEQVVVFDGERTRLPMSLMPGDERQMQASVVAPASPGRYMLRLTLVQEGIAWLDGSGSTAFCDAVVTVR